MPSKDQTNKAQSPPIGLRVMESLISLEDHWISKAMLASPSVDKFGFNLFPKQVFENLFDAADRRITAMDEGGIALQVVSSIPAAEQLQVCRDTNEELAHHVRQSRGRLAGFATLPMADAAAAAQELRRCISTLGFLGALIPNHANGLYYDGEEFRVFWKAAQELDVPIYLHPTSPAQHRLDQFAGNFDPKAQKILSQQGFGWHTDVAEHFLKLYASGLFEPDNCPQLKLVLGHMGETLPFMIRRSNVRLGMNWKSQERDLLTVWSENVWITLSGMWDLSPMACLLRSTSISRIMYSVDWPLESNVAGAEFMRELKDSGLVSPEDFDRIAFKNAQELLKLRYRPSAHISKR